MINKNNVKDNLIHGREVYESQCPKVVSHDSFLKLAKTLNVKIMSMLTDAAAESLEEAGCQAFVDAHAGFSSADIYPVAQSNDTVGCFLDSGFSDVALAFHLSGYDWVADVKPFFDSLLNASSPVKYAFVDAASLVKSSNKYSDSFVPFNTAMKTFFDDNGIQIFADFNPSEYDTLLHQDMDALLVLDVLFQVADAVGVNMDGMPSVVTRYANCLGVNATQDSTTAGVDLGERTWFLVDKLWLGDSSLEEDAFTKDVRQELHCMMAKDNCHGPFSPGASAIAYRGSSLTILIIQSKDIWLQFGWGQDRSIARRFSTRTVIPIAGATCAILLILLIS